MEPDQQPRTIVTIPTKSVGLAILLTFLFGPLGMFYSTIKGAVIMLIIEFIVAIATAGLGLFITWPIPIIWGAIAAKNYNKRLLSEGISYE